MLIRRYLLKVTDFQEENVQLAEKMGRIEKIGKA